MKKEQKLNIITTISIILAVGFSMIISYAPGVFALEAIQSAKQYETELFDSSQIMTVDIQMDESQWQEMLDNAMSEEYYQCAVIINGITYQNVGIRPKGNTSLSQVASDSTTDRYSFKIEFDHYVDQTCMGLDKLVLNNNISDVSYKKEFFAYEILSYLGVPSPLHSFAEITVNGEAWGLYLALEAIEEAFMERNFGSSYGKLYKPEVSGMGGGMNAGGGTDLAYIDNESSSYYAIFDSAVFSSSEKDYQRVITALKNISEGNSLESYVNIDQMLRYIAANVFLINDDSYFGNMLHNYYLYEKDGKLTMLPWDYNLAFGGFQSRDTGDLINRGIDDVVSGTTLEERPMIGKLLEAEEYKETYYQYLNELVTGYIHSGQFEETYQMISEQIDSYVKEDATAFYTYEEYQEASKNLEAFIQLRAEAIQKQLDRAIPKTKEEQQQSGAELVDASSISLSAMGSMGGGMREGNQRPDFTAEKMQIELPDTGENGETNEAVRDTENSEMPQEAFQPQENQQRGPGGGRMPFGENAQNSMQSQQVTEKIGYIWLAISFVILIGGLCFVKLYPRSKY